MQGKGGIGNNNMTNKEFNRGYEWAKNTYLTASLKRSILKYEKKRRSAWDKGCAKAVREKGGLKQKIREKSNQFRTPTMAELMRM